MTSFIYFNSIYCIYSIDTSNSNSYKRDGLPWRHKYPEHLIKLHKRDHNTRAPMITWLHFDKHHRYYLIFYTWKTIFEGWTTLRVTMSFSEYMCILFIFIILWKYLFGWQLFSFQIFLLWANLWNCSDSAVFIFVLILIWLLL